MRSRRASAVRIGAFVVGGTAILVAAILMIGTGRLFRRTQSFVSYFEGSVHGLRVGAPVKYKGVELGTVTRIRIPFWLEGPDPPIAVFYALEQESLAEMEEGEGPTRADMQEAIARGLRARLETDSVVTNVKYVALSIVQDAPARLHGPAEDVLEIPTVPGALEEIGATVQTLVGRLTRYEFETLLDELRSTLEAVGGLAGSSELRELLVSSERLVADLDRLVLAIEPLVPELEELATSGAALADELAARSGPVAASLDDAAESVRAAADAVLATFDSAGTLLDPEAPLALELRATLRELTDTARAARALFDLLERDPSALIRGRAGPIDR